MSHVKYINSREAMQVVSLLYLKRCALIQLRVFRPNLNRYIGVKPHIGHTARMLLPGQAAGSITKNGQDIVCLS